jgi:glycosyltransferase involved in cell wall biosynthesis
MSSNISVVIPTYNRAQYLPETLASILGQSLPAHEVIVVDDGSTDDTAAIVHRLATSHPSIRLIAGPRAGVSRARNAGLAAVPPNRDYITFLDADDHCFPGRIGRQIEILKNNRDVEFVIGLMQFFEAIDEDTSLIIEGSRTTVVTGVQLAAALFRRSIFDRIGNFDENMPQGEDTDFFLRLMETQTPYRLENEVAVLYRRHATNMTNDVAQVRRGFVDALRRSLARRRASGRSVEIGDLFKKRSSVEELFGNA